MTNPQTLFSLFGNFSNVWPHQRFQFPDPGGLAELGAATLTNVRTGIADGRLSVTAELQTPLIVRISLTSMPGVEFRVQSATGIRFFASVSTSSGAVETVLEGLPVEILLPPGLVQPSGVADIGSGSFVPGTLDSLAITYRSDGPTSIMVHIRVHVDEEGECVIRPSVPISFSNCILSGLPCKAVHDFSLIPSPNIARKNVEWIRHAVTPWLPNASGPFVGLFAARSLHLDTTKPPLQSVAEWLNSDSESDSTAEFVLDDLVVPFFSPYVLPIPRHLTVGLRRQILDPAEVEQVFKFDQAPFKKTLRPDPLIEFILESLFYKSLPSADLSTDSGLTFSAGIVFLGSKSTDDAPDPSQAFVFELGENYTIRAGYRRDVAKPDTPLQGIHRVFHTEVFGIVIDILAIRLGYSVGLAVQGNASLKDAGEITVDLWVFMDETPDDTSKGNFLELQTLEGEDVAFAMEGIGWRQGSFHVEGFDVPDGVAVILAKKFKFIIQEIGLVADSGASYVSFSGGIAWETPAEFKSEVLVKRLRFRVGGDRDAPFMKMDGFFISLRSKTVDIEAGGFFTDRYVGSAHIREFGLTGAVALTLEPSKYRFGLDLLVGSVEDSPAVEYFLIQAFFQGTVPLAWFELRSARLLFARNMLPLLRPVDKSSQQLRYYNWSRAQNPLEVSGARLLSTAGPNPVWKMQGGAWTLGIGAGVSIAGLGKVVELTAFVLVICSDDERGILISGELRSGSDTGSTTPTPPLGYFALEWDGKNSRFSLLIGVNLTVKTFVRSAPKWLDDIAKLTGTVYISNDPGTFAIGRLADERTWLSLIFNFDMWVKTYVLFGFCMEYVDGPSGAKGVGLVVRIDGGINAGIVRVSYNASFGFLIQVFTTGSTDYSSAIWIEAGLYIVLFGFLRFGISAGASFRNVGYRPSRGELQAEFRLNTPWFLPDVTWTFEISFGDLQPKLLKSCVSPLRIAGATEGLTQKDAKLFTMRTVAAWDGNGQAPTFSISDLSAALSGVSDPAQTAQTVRAGKFKGALNADPVTEADQKVNPIATDSTIAIDWSVAVNDQLGIGAGAALKLGIQRSGDLTLTYDLVGIAVRRRSRFAAAGLWTTLENPVELPASFSTSGGVALTGVLASEQLSKHWDTEVRIAGQTGTKRLLINAATPFAYQSANPEVDEQLLRDHPNWPCCSEDDQKSAPPIHQVSFQGESPGTELDKPRRFTESQSLLRFLRPTHAVSRSFNSTAGLAAVAETAQPGPVFRADLEEDAAYVFLTVGWRRANAILRVVLFDAAGMPVGEKSIPMSADKGLSPIFIPGLGPIRRIEVQITQDVRRTTVGSAVGGSTPAQTSGGIAAAAAVRPLVGGIGFGSVNVTAAAAGPQPSFTAGLIITVGITQNAILNLSIPAPPGGLTVPLTSSNTAVATVPASVSFAPGAVSVPVPVTAVGLGSTQINAFLPDGNATASVKVLGQPSINVTNTALGLGFSGSLEVTLPAPAPAGGVAVNLASSDPLKVTVPASFFIPANATVPIIQPRVTAINLGSVTITASASGYASGSGGVRVMAMLSFSGSPMAIHANTFGNLTLNLSGGKAPAGGFTVNLNSSNITVATVPSTVTFTANATSVSVPVTGVAQGAVTITASVPNISNATARVNVEGLPPSPNYHVEIWNVSYVGLRPYLDSVRQRIRCDDGSHSHAGFEGRGKLFFLPNHEYEIGLTTRMTIAHPSTGSTPAPVTEYVYFATKGLPGLNAVGRTGEEIEPYVNSVYTGGKGMLYQEEPIALAFKEDFSISLPLMDRPVGTSDEHATLLKMQLLARPETAPTLSTPLTTTSPDWIVAHRQFSAEVPSAAWKSIVSASVLTPSNTVSSDPFRARLAGLTQQPRIRGFEGGQPCFIADPRKVVSPVLVAPPQGVPDPVKPGSELWTSTRHTATVRLEGAPYINRPGFAAPDVTAFRFAMDTGTGGDADWAEVDRALTISAADRRFALFGEGHWNHVVIETTIGAGAVLAGVGMALPTSDTPDRGLFAVIETVVQSAVTTRRIAVYRRDSGLNFDIVAYTALPASTDPAAPITLVVTAFDDILRAEVGDTRLEVARNEFREGRLCLLAQGAAQFASLRVTGLDMYSFGFAVSRFRSFAEHIQSYPGSLDVIGPGSFGGGTTAMSTAALWATTASEVRQAMLPDQAAAERQALFDKWVAQMEVALKDDVTSLQISCFVSGGQIEFFLLESPEPLDFTHEVTLALARRDFVTFVTQPQNPAVNFATATGATAVTASQQVLDLLLSTQQIATAQSVQSAHPAAQAFMKDIVHLGDSLAVEIDLKNLRVNATSQGKMNFAEIVEEGSEPRLRFFTGKVESKGTGLRTTIQAQATDDLSVKSASGSLLASTQLTAFPKGTIIALSPDLQTPVDWYFPRVVYTPVTAQILQNAKGTRALVIPLSNGAPLQLSSLGTYRMTFTIGRNRWMTTDPPDSRNRYAATSTLTLVAGNLRVATGNTLSGQPSINPVASL